MRGKILLILLCLLLLASPLLAKSYSITNASIKMQIHDDASIDADETLTFLFSGQYTFAYRDIPNGSWHISEISVTENETPVPFTVTPINNQTRIRWTYTANSEIRTFTIHYRLENAIKAYSDVADLNWKVWGDNWEVPVTNLYGEIILPKPVSDAKQVYSWGHPKIEGKMGLENNQKLIFQTLYAPANQWVEIRMAFPRELLTTVTYAQTENSPGLQKIESEEKQFALYDSLSIFLIPLLILAFIGFLIWTYLSFGKDPEVSYHAIYEREPPYEYGPAIVQALSRDFSHTPDSKSFVAEMFYLAWLGYLQFEKIPKEKILGVFGRDYDYNVRYANPKKPVSLSDSQNHLLSLLKKYTDNQNPFAFSKFEEKTRQQTGEFQKDFKAWQKLVETEAKKMDFFEKKSGLKRLIVGTLAFIIALAILVPAGAIFLIWISFLAFPVFAHIISKRTEKGTLHHKQWENFKKFLNDFSQIKQYPPESLVLWEKYLVYAIGFGIAHKVAQYMKLLVSERELTNSAIFVGGYHGGWNDVNAFAQSAVAYAPSFATASGTSGSGGFGGGGGGGGGGG